MTIVRVARIHGFGGTDMIRIDEMEVPAPRAGEVRLRMKAHGVVRGDILRRYGLYPAQPQPPLIFGFEGVGEIESLGAEVSGFAIGDMVGVLPVPSAQYGVCGELAVIDASQLVPHPAGVSLEKGAALWSSYLTAYNGLVFDGGLRAGEPVVITAGSSAVGIAAIQIARKIGAIPIAVTRGADKVERIRSFGAEHVIVTDTCDDLAAEIKTLTGGQGLRIAFDAVGGSQLLSLIEAMQTNGIVVNYGMLDPTPIELSLATLLTKAITLRGSNLTHVLLDPIKRQTAIDFVSEGVEQGPLDPPVEAVFAFDQIGAAHELVETNTTAGKVVVRISL
ncbi:hypothetical protein EWE75_19880 [Sphingomonas populi]|uniref:Enoyl reductase (ER) domain-containing protein n=1 Tax=Sphingomonas populi TaxID=2484750 RepID=A0A4Q6XX16_9SPHN|nr:zinc-dependent alcohol dehydrogenase family protein [Sphingomonas populi]RZF61026.1 hypothetical protein EWE75_19880 [Sphingomonas populi]